MAENSQYPSLVLGLDISTTCIGISIVYDDGENEPNVELISHVSPKIDKKIKGIEALILRKQIFENDFLNRMDDILAGINCPLKKITDCVIESPMTRTSGKSNAETVAQLLQFNGLLSESVYRVLHLVPNYVSSYDARMQSFPELLSVRKFNKKGEEYPVKHIENALKDNKVVLFGSYPFDCDKKSIMMNMVCDKYPNIDWILDKNGNLKKENFDSCDALVCALAFCNTRKYGELNATITEWKKEYKIYGPTISYLMRVWDRLYYKEILLTEDLNIKED